MLVDVIVNFVLMLAIPFVAIQKLSVFNAIKESIIVCMKNLISLIFLLIVYFVLAILATFSIIGWLVLFPVLIGSIYIIFKEHLQCTK
jgi:membrane-anchored glycerophosphoryl diester phosphodiesterase (GDPDase)